MNGPDRPVSYSAAMKTFHWATVAIVVALLALGWTMSDMPHTSPWTGKFYAWHKSLGVLVLFVTLARLAWRLALGVPPEEPTLKRWESVLSGLVHRLLYATLILQPLVGWALTTVAKKPLVFFGLFSLPGLPFLPNFEDPAAAVGVVWDIHSTLGSVIAWLFVLHAGAALKHHFLDRDGVLLRMAPGFLAPLLRRLRGSR